MDVGLGGGFDIDIFELDFALRLDNLITRRAQSVAQLREDQRANRVLVETGDGTECGRIVEFLLICLAIVVAVGFLCFSITGKGAYYRCEKI
jgi:hypothetical protein